MRFVGPEDKCIASHDLSCAIFVSNASLPRDDQVKLPLRRVCVVRKIWFSGRHPTPFHIKWMALGINRGTRFASECFRNSFERNGVFSAWRLPWFFFDLVSLSECYLCRIILEPCIGSFFAIEIIGLRSFHDDFFRSFLVTAHFPLSG